MQNNKAAFSAPQTCEACYNRRGKSHRDLGFDRCVVCGAITEFYFSDPIDKREHYIEGAGQLCSTCAMRFDRTSF